MDSIIKRSDKLAFMEITSGNSTTLKRLRGFTELSVSKNPIEYNRHYMDEDSERSDIVGYSPSISYSFDSFEDDDVHKEIISISDNELMGSGAIRAIVVVDLTTTTGNNNSTFKAIKREYAIIPDSEGGETDAYTYSGTMKANGAKIFGSATSADGWLTCTFTADE